jgi:hypothetical protein
MKLKSLRELVLEEYSQEHIEGYCKANSCGAEDAIQAFMRYVALSEPPHTQERRRLFSSIERDITHWKTIEQKDLPNLLKMVDYDIIEMNTINVIAGSYGVHKSRLGHCFQAALLAESLSFPELHVRGILGKPPIVVLIDAEHNTGQLVRIRKRILTLARVKAGVPPDNFIIVSLKQFGKKEDRLEQFLEYLGSQYPDQHKVIMIDTVTDIIGDINDLEKSTALIEMLNSNLDRVNCTFICVIHEIFSNGRPKPRGHIGSEIQNKASTTIRISKASNGNFKVEFQKLRSGILPKPIPVTFCDATEGLRLVSCDGQIPDVQTPGRRWAFSEDELFDAMRCLLNGPCPKKDLVNTLVNRFKCSDRTIKDRLKDIDRLLIDGVEYSLIQKKVCGRAEMMLEPV